jgi:UDP-glucose-4-epimerase GalE
MSAVLVTGGAGYIGGHAAKALAASGRDLVIYDDLSAGHEAVVRRIQTAYPAARVIFVRGDVRDRTRLAAAMREHGVSAVMHFAARLSVAESVTDPAGYYDANVRGSLSLLEAMVEAGVRRLVFSSTAATFGEPITTPIDESHPQRPINAYGETKLAIERALPHFARAFGLQSVALRYFNAAGADPDGLLGEDHQPEEHLVPRAIAAVMGGPPLVIFGDDYPTPDGTCVRDFVHVADLADAHMLALVHLERGGASAAYNLGNGHGISVRELVVAIARVTGLAVPVTKGPRRDGDPSALVASSARAMRELGWTPKLGHVDAIVETAWRWHRSHPHGYRGGYQA